MYDHLTRAVTNSIPSIVVAAWPFFAAFGAICVAGWVLARRHRRRIRRSGIAVIDRMDGDDFEQRLEALFRDLGYSVRRTPYGGDYGADLIISKDGVKSAVQAKRYSGKVGLEAVQEVVAAKAYYGCDAAMVVTNSFYTRPARTLARTNEVELWDRSRLVDALVEGQQPVRRLPALQRRLAVLAIAALLVVGSELGLGYFVQTHGGSWAALGSVSMRQLAVAAALPLPKAKGATCGRATVSGVGSLIIRAAPGMNTPKLGARQASTTVDLLCDAPVDAGGHTWRRVRSGDLQGWMSAQFLKIRPAGE